MPTPHTAPPHDGARIVVENYPFDGFWRAYHEDYSGTVEAFGESRSDAMADLLRFVARTWGIELEEPGDESPAAAPPLSQHREEQLKDLWLVAGVRAATELLAILQADSDNARRRLVRLSRIWIRVLRRLFVASRGR